MALQTKQIVIQYEPKGVIDTELLQREWESIGKPVQILHDCDFTKLEDEIM